MPPRVVCLGLVASLFLVFVGRASAQSLDAGVWLDANLTSNSDEPADASVQTAPVALEPSPALPPRDVSVIDVTARLTTAQRMQRSAEAVDVVDTQAARRRSADLGEVLSQQPGVLVRRAGGLGSSARLTLNGLSDDQIRIFYDGLPIDFVGYGMGIANFPVNLIERIEIYRGVVPLRFASDALGGAINLVPRQIQRGTHGSASLTVGSWGTYRTTLNVRHRAKNGFYANVSAFLDDAKNDYPVRVGVAEPDGSTRVRNERRFHNHYRAGGASAEVGFLGKRWADQLLLGVFGTKWSGDIQNNVDMTQVYGSASNSQLVPAAVLQYEKRDLLPSFDVFAVAGYSYSDRHVDDTSQDAYVWTGQVVRTRRTSVGELGGALTRRRLHDDNTYSRLMLQYRLGEAHTFRAMTRPASSYRKGEDKLYSSQLADPLESPQRLVSVVSGLEYQLELLDERLENVAFLKHYFYKGDATEDTQLFGTRPVARRDSIPGWGDAARFRVVSWLWLKASYEYASRLPAGTEVFGDGALLDPSPSLRPERSHNVNLSAQVDGQIPHVGAVRSQLAYFRRNAKDLIALTANQSTGRATYKNIYDAHVRGVDASAGWTSLGDYLALDGNVTYIDFRNTSTRGVYEDFKGQRIPNRPWLLANASARAQLSDAFFKGDTVALHFGARFVKKFFLAWESAGTAASKYFVPNQMQYSTGLEYLFHALGNDFSASFDVLNLSNAVIYDFFGVQKPGRSYYGKITATF